MITLVGRWESGWLKPEVELFMWKQLCHAFNVDRLVMVPKELERVTSLDQYDTMEEAIDSCKGEIILMEPTGNITITQIEHPDDAVYVFGNAMNHNKQFDGQQVRIDTPSHIDMFAINAAAIVLADRYEH